MKTQIRFCDKCRNYTLRDNCLICKSKTKNPIPQKYSVEDKYAKYRRTAKYEDRKAKGLVSNEKSKAIQEQLP